MYVPILEGSNTGAALPGQEGKDVRLKKEVTINMFLGGAWDNVRGWGEARHPPRWTLLCVSKEDVTAMTTAMVAVM